MNIEDVFQEDEVIITGTATSPPGRVVNFACMISTVSKGSDDPDKPPAIKVWPMKQNDPAITPEMNEHGKIWFPWKNIESITITLLSELRPE